MPVIPNSWVEKLRKKRDPVTAPSYDYESEDTYSVSSTKKPKKRSTLASSSFMLKTLRGVRK